MRLGRYGARGYETLMLLEGADWLIWLPSDDVEVNNPVKMFFRRRFHREEFWDPQKRKRLAETVTIKFSQTLVDSVDALFYGMWEAEQYWSM